MANAGRDRILQMLATGTGKTAIAMQEKDIVSLQSWLKRNGKAAQ